MKELDIVIELTLLIVITYLFLRDKDNRLLIRSLQESLKRLPMVGATGATGPMGMRGDPGMTVRDQKILAARISLLGLRAQDIINNEEFIRIREMIHSPDEENLIVAEELIKQLNK